MIRYHLAAGHARVAAQLAERADDPGAVATRQRCQSRHPNGLDGRFSALHTLITPNTSRNPPHISGTRRVSAGRQPTELRSLPRLQVIRPYAGVPGPGVCQCFAVASGRLLLLACKRVLRASWAAWATRSGG